MRWLPLCGVKGLVHFTPDWFRISSGQLCRGVATSTGLVPTSFESIATGHVCCAVAVAISADVAPFVRA
jgi:hypothetical protein